MFPNYNIKGKVENEKYKQRITNNLLNALKYRNMVYKKYLESIHNSQLQLEPVVESVIEPVIEQVVEQVVEPVVDPVNKPVYVTPNFYWNTI